MGIENRTSFRASLVHLECSLHIFLLCIKPELIVVVLLYQWERG